MRPLIAFVLLALAAGCGTLGGHNADPGSLDDAQEAKSDATWVAQIRAERIRQIKRQAPLLGIPTKDALAAVVEKIWLCRTDRYNGDGGYSCDKSCVQVSGCIHAWCMSAPGHPRVSYLFCIPRLKTGCVAHEVHHELMVRFYAIGGHPKRSTITRLTDGKRVTVDHRAVIGWRWPALVNGLLPQSLEMDGWDDFLCGADELNREARP